jgi:hypothetical protein
MEIYVPQPRESAKILELDKLATFRRQGFDASLECADEMSEAVGRKILPLFARRGPGAAAVVDTLADLGANGPIVKNTYTGPATNLDTGVNGSFPLDYFAKKGATFEIEAMGLLSTTATPTIVFRFTFGTVIGTITTMLAQHAAITTVSAAANLDWFIKLHCIVVVFAGTASTILCTGYMLNQFATAAAGNNLTFLKNATPPTAVAVDLVTAGIFFDLQTTWGASSVSNQITTNLYQLQSEAA